MSMEYTEFIINIFRYLALRATIIFNTIVSILSIIFPISRRLRLSCLNVRVCGVEKKKCEIRNLFERGSLDVLALSETKMKEKSEVYF